MTLQEYLDPGRFPLTTQRGLSPRGQLFIDAVNYDALMELADEGGPFSDSQRARWAELAAKREHRARLMRELAAAAKAAGRQQA